MTVYNATTLAAIPPCRTGAGFGQSEDYTVNIDPGAPLPPALPNLSKTFTPNNRDFATPTTTLTLNLGQFNAGAASLNLTADLVDTLPVGMTVAEDGAIWLVEDKNQTVIRIDRAAGDAPSPLPCDVRSQALIEQLAVFVARDAQNSVRLTNLRKGLVEKHCVGCHSDFGLKPGQSDTQKDATVLRFMLSQDGWIYPGDPDSGKLRTRLRGLGAERLMPPGGEGLPKAEPGYTRLLDTADLLVSKMVPGIRMRIKSGPPQRKFFGKTN
jgi:hypothetical protein